MIGDGWQSPPDRTGRSSGIGVLAVGVAVTVIALVALAMQGVRGDRIVTAENAAASVHDAALNDAFYRCIGVQARTLVSPGQPALVSDADFGHVVILIMAVGAWLDVADPPSSAVALLSLHDGVKSGDTCLGTVVVATYPRHHGAPVVRIGSGARLAGSGPPPPPPL